MTLKRKGLLRGCIGSIYPTKPLILDLIDNAKNAAFQDSRFIPLEPHELNDLEISISIISPRLTNVSGSALIVIDPSSASGVSKFKLA